MAEVTLPDGWELVHEQPEQTEPIAGQNVLQVTPASYRAEKQLNGTLVNAEAASPELLAERIDAIEAQVASALHDPVGAPASEPPTFEQQVITEGETDPQPEEVEVNLKTVITSEGAFTEEEWSLRSKTDTIVTADGQTFYTGVGEQTAEIEAALDQTAADTQDAENEATSDPFAKKTKTKQMVYDTADSVDHPGQSAGGTLIVPEGVDSMAEASIAMDAANAAAEQERTKDTQALPEAETTEAEEPNATAGAVEAADELGVDLNSVEGTGKDGKITKADVESAANNG
jgi:pyruvate/2-oxoglutarate dehydrogenase complex dihydrolipoamide acyltransferase (E2) component